MEPLFNKRTLGPGLDRLLGMSGFWLRRWAPSGYFSADVNKLELKRVLLLACHWIGDTFWASQVVGPLRERLGPNALWAATKPRSLDLWRGLIPEERVLTLQHVISDRRRETFTWGGLWQDAGRLRAESFDLILDLTCNRYSALVGFLARPRRCYGCAGHELTRLYSTAPPEFPPDLHQALRPFFVASPLLGPPPRRAPACQAVQLPLDMEGSLRDAVRALGIDPERPYVVLAPGAGWKSKQWPADRFALLAAQLEASGLEVVAVGSEPERALLETTLARTERGVVSTAAIGPLGILLDRARLVVSNDSAVGHLAAAQGTPVVSLFNSTNPIQNRPLGKRVRVLRSDCPERPEGAQLHCHDQPEYPCTASCWNGLDTQRVLAVCKQQLLA